MRSVLFVGSVAVCGFLLLGGCGDTSKEKGEADGDAGGTSEPTDGSGGNETPGSGGTGGVECPSGTERCPCYGNGTCNEGLVCLSDLCVDAGVGGETGTGGSTPGDGGAQSAGAGGTPVAGSGGESTAGDSGAPGVAGDAAGGGSAGLAGGAGSGGGAGVAGSWVAAGSAGVAGVVADAGSAGTSGAGGDAGAGAGAGGAGGVIQIPEGPSCAAMTGTECGDGESCCTSIVVPGGTFPMGRGTETCAGCTDGCPSGMTCYPAEQPEHPATVSSFAMDKYEVTVGRFRAFVEDGAGTQSNPPPAGSGVHPLIVGSAWDSAWNSFLPANQTELIAHLSCHSTDQTWTDSPGANETYPMNCVTWYEAFAFCIWDGGRLPTEAEWEYAAAGGDENRVYPWGDDVIEPLPASYLGNSDLPPFIAVGNYPDGNGRWGHADLAGSMLEWVLDWYASDYYATTGNDCSDCANVTAATLRLSRGGRWDEQANGLRAACRNSGSPDGSTTAIGFRCSRTP